MALKELAEAFTEAAEGCVEGCPVKAIAEHLTRLAGDGPAQVATPEYRSSWDRTFGGKKQVVGQA